MMSTSPPASSPSTAAIAIATAIVCSVGGYYIGQASSLGLFGGGSKTKKESWPNSYDVTIHPDSSDEELMEKLKGRPGNGDEEDDEEDEEEEDSDDDQSELKTFNGNTEECKLVLVVRADLGMGKGTSPPLAFQHLFPHIL